jgi:DNA-binding LacI/PurR family transcriptional regulator
MGRRHTARTTQARHQRIAVQLRQMLVEGNYQPGDRFPSQYELAERFKTSPLTAREAVAPLVEEGLLERRFGSGTFVLRTQPETFIGVCTAMDISHPALSPYFLHLIQAVRRSLEAKGHRTRFYTGHAAPFGAPPERWEGADLPADLAARRLSGIVMIGTDPRLSASVLGDGKLPFVDAAGMGGRPLWDMQGEVRLAAKRLADLGCHRVACIAWGEPGQRPRSLETFVETARTRGLGVRDEWLVTTRTTKQMGDGAAAFRRIWDALPEKPDGLYVQDDILYRDLAPHLLLQRIQIPEQLKIVSHINPRDTRPLLPTPVGIGPDPHELGEVLAANLCARLADTKAPATGLPVPVRFYHAASPSEWVAEEMERTKA